MHENVAMSPLLALSKSVERLWMHSGAYTGNLSIHLFYVWIPFRRKTRLRACKVLSRDAFLSVPSSYFDWRPWPYSIRWLFFWLLALLTPLFPAINKLGKRNAAEWSKDTLLSSSFSWLAGKMYVVYVLAGSHQMYEPTSFISRIIATSKSLRFCAKRKEANLHFRQKRWKRIKNVQSCSLRHTPAYLLLPSLSQEAFIKAMLNCTANMCMRQTFPFHPWASLTTLKCPSDRIYTWRLAWT